MTTLTDDEQYCSMLTQRRLAQLSNIPQIRFTLNSPYVGYRYSEYDLNMRRKAEILKYAPNNSASQTNKLTKKQQWTQLVNAPSKSVPVNSADLAVLVCPSDRMIPTPTWKCDVPGPMINLYNDETVPLYSFGTSSERTYPDNMNTNYTFWTVITAQDKLVQNNVETSLCTITIKENIDAPRYNLTFSTGVGFYVYGEIMDNALVKINPYTISLDSVFLNIYYSGYLYKSTPVPATLQDFVFDVSGFYGKFNAVQFVGNVITPIVSIYTEPGYVYEVKLVINLNINGGGLNYMKSLNVLSYANLSNVNNEIKNCYVRSTPSPQTNIGFNIGFSAVD
jgi:hypothetical protein